MSLISVYMLLYNYANMLKTLQYYYRLISCTELSKYYFFALCSIYSFDLTNSKQKGTEK